MCMKLYLYDDPTFGGYLLWVGAVHATETRHKTQELPVCVCLKIRPWYQTLCTTYIMHNMVLLLASTHGPHTTPMCAQVKELHPYDEPEVIGLPVIGGSISYLKWVVESTTQ